MNIRALTSVSVSLLSVFALIGCTQTPKSVSPSDVDTKKVNGVVVAPTAEAATACAADIRRSGGKVLYQSETGLLLTDKKVSDLSLEQCEAIKTDNTAVELERPAAPLNGEKRPDLNTLLKLIPAEEIGARSFVNDNPTFDGRGVVVAVLDTGIELDHKMLQKTTTGAPKILDFQDFSGEGRVNLEPATLQGDQLVTASGASYAVKTLTGSDFKAGVFKGSSLVYSEDVTALDTFEDVAVISYKNADGKLKGRIDTNNDKSFDDEAELASYKESLAFTKLGKKKILSTTLNLGADGSSASLAFDDGAHGTHVAGIAAGFDPNGLQGVAPGAQVILGKIGDNRLAGGSTTTASMLLAIDFAVESKAQVINLSYGIRSGTNIGKSAIDQYVDKVAKEKGVIFSISAGNEGPGLLTIGTPAAANLAITNGAYVSKETARLNYGYLGVEDDNTWFFSSVGPRLDGGLKPTLLAPGSALSSVPNWNGFHGNFRGTSMASPQTTGGLALILSAAQQQKLLTDRASVTRAVYDSAKKIGNLTLIEQGHGLMNVPAAVKRLAEIKSKPVEYTIAVNSPTSPTGRGAGIYVRSRLLPSNLFTVTLTPDVGSGEATPLRTLRMQASSPEISVPDTIWVQGFAKTFQVDLSPELSKKPGLHSEKITAFDEASGEVAFEVPVTVVVPELLNEGNDYTFQVQKTIRVGQTLRYFVELPAGTTALEANLSSDGPVLWAQILDPEGRKVTELRDTEGSSPMPALNVAANVKRAGVYEIDVVAAATLKRHTNFSLSLRAYSLVPSVGPGEKANSLNVAVQNNFTAVKLIPKLEVSAVKATRTVEITGNEIRLPLSFNAEDVKQFSKISLNVVTSKKLYDLMTDYPFRVFDSKAHMLASGGLELDSLIEIGDLEDQELGDLTVELQGAFTKAPPEKWIVQITEERTLKSPVTLKVGNRLLLEPAQSLDIPVDLAGVPASTKEGLASCPVLHLTSVGGKSLQQISLCE